jgi:hypothetical protein
MAIFAGLPGNTFGDVNCDGAVDVVNALAIAALRGGAAAFAFGAGVSGIGSPV